MDMTRLRNSVHVRRAHGGCAYLFRLLIRKRRGHSCKPQPPSRRARQPAAAGPAAARRPRRSDALGGAPQRPCAARRPRGAPLALMPPSGAAREAEEEAEYDGTFPPTAQARGRRRSAALGRRLCDAESSRRAALFRRLRRTAAAAARARTSPAPGTPPPSRHAHHKAPQQPQSPQTHPFIASAVCLARRSRRVPSAAEPGRLPRGARRAVPQAHRGRYAPPAPSQRALFLSDLAARLLYSLLSLRLSPRSATAAERDAGAAPLVRRARAGADERVPAVHVHAGAALRRNAHRRRPNGRHRAPDGALGRRRLAGGLARRVGPAARLPGALAGRYRAHVVSHADRAPGRRP